MDIKFTFIALFLPLFPLSVVQNLLLARLPSASARGALILLWPQLGITLLEILHPEIPDFVLTWALLSAALYALQLLTVRDLTLWTGLLVSSALAFTWELIARGANVTELRLFVFWFTLPPALLALLAGRLAHHFGAAYAGLFAGLAERQQRLAIVLTITLLGAVATPPFPGFFGMLSVLRTIGSTGALAVLVIWLFWGWAAIRMLEGFVTGRGREISAADLGRSRMLAYLATLAIFVLAGQQLLGGGL